MPLPIIARHPRTHRPGWSSRVVAVAAAVVLLTAPWSPGRAADPAPFELVGPSLAVTVTRGGATLPIGAVPSLAEGDVLAVSARLPEDQGAKFLLLSAFLRGATNPPPKDWIATAQTWQRKAKDNSLSLTVPRGARQLTLFLVPETGGAASSIVEAVRGKPGEFVRATQELNQASLDRSRLDAFMAAIRAQENSHPEYLKKVAPTLARSLSMKLNEECLTKLIEAQAACLLENRESLVLADVHSSSIAETLTGAPTDLALQLSATREAGYGYYSPYIGVIRDVARIFGAFSNPELGYLPTLSLRREAEITVMLNTAPSFRKPKSVLVVGMPAIEADSPPRLRSTADGPICAGSPGTLLPLEGAPLIYSTRYARDMAVRLTAASGETADLPVEARADRGGYVVTGGPSLPDAFKGTIRAHLHGHWGFDAFDGPDFILQRPGRSPGQGQSPGPESGTWRVAGEAPALVIGRDNALVLNGEAPACVDAVTVRQDGAAAQAIGWKVQGNDALALTLPLADRRPGPLRIEVTYQGVANPSVVALRAYAQGSKLEALTLHAGDDGAVLTGQRLDQVASVEIGDLTLKPGGLTREGSRDRLRLDAAVAAVSAKERALVRAWGQGTETAARILLEDGRSVTVPVVIAAPRPRVALIAKTVEPGAPSTGKVLELAGDDVLPDTGRLTFSVRAAEGTRLTAGDAIEVATADGGAVARLVTGTGAGLRLEGPEVMVATLDPAMAAAGTFGPLRFRIVRGEEAGDWQPLVTLARLPRIETVLCGGKDGGCTIRGRDLFLIDAVAATPGFDRAAQVAQGYTGSTLAVPAPQDGKLYVRLRDAPDARVVLSAAPAA